MLYQDMNFQVCLCLFGWKELEMYKEHIVHCSGAGRLNGQFYSYLDLGNRSFIQNHNFLPFFFFRPSWSIFLAPVVKTNIFALSGRSLDFVHIGRLRAHLKCLAISRSNSRTGGVHLSSTLLAFYTFPKRKLAKYYLADLFPLRGGGTLRLIV